MGAVRALGRGPCGRPVDDGRRRGRERPGRPRGTPGLAPASRCWRWSRWPTSTSRSTAPAASSPRRPYPPGRRTTRRRLASSPSCRRRRSTAPTSTRTARCPSCSASPGPASPCTPARCRGIPPRTAACGCPCRSPASCSTRPSSACAWSSCVRICGRPISPTRLCSSRNRCPRSWARGSPCCPSAGRSSAARARRRARSCRARRGMCASCSRSPPPRPASWSRPSNG